LKLGNPFSQTSGFVLVFKTVKCKRGIRLYITTMLMKYIATRSRKKRYNECVLDRTGYTSNFVMKLMMQLFGKVAESRN